MRSLPPNPLLYRRLSLKRAFALVGIVALSGCAKFPDAGATGNFVRVIFDIQYAGEINPNYIYDVALRATPDLNPTPQTAPVPVITDNTANGRVAGSPTHFVEFSGNNTEPFILYRFATQNEIPNTSDPTNPINLKVFAQSTRGRIINYIAPTTSSKVLHFELFMNLVADDDAAARLLNTLQVNLLTMNRLASTGGGGTRSIDALGDTRTSDLNQYLAVDLRANRTYRNSDSLLEPAGDTLPLGQTSDPALDIVGYTIEVQRP